MEKQIPLHCLPPEGVATVEDINLVGAMGRRAGDLGLTEGTKIICVHQSPSGDPRGYLIRGAVMALRNQDASKILVRTEEEPWKP